MTSFQQKYQLTDVINASGKMTILGVSKYREAALNAQQEAGKNFYIMEELVDHVGKYLADLIDVEAAHVVSSASAGIAQSVAAIIGQGSAYHCMHPYTDQITSREIILPKGHNVDYGAPIEVMIEVGGGRLVEAGYANKCTPEMIEAAITSETAAIFYVKSHHAVQKSMSTVAEVAAVAHKHQLPLIVDAAAEQDVHKYVEQGADIVIYSGTKAFEGPSSGLVIGRKKYVDWARLQSQGIGRAMKIGKENILGLAAAIEDYLQQGPETATRMMERLDPFIVSLNHVPFIHAEAVQDEAGREIYRARVTFSEDFSGTAMQVAAQLKQGSPAIYTRDYHTNEGIIDFDIRALDEHDMARIVEKLEQVLTHFI